MKKFLLSFIAVIAVVAVAQAAALVNYQPGFRLIDGDQLNKMVAVVNNLTGNGTAQPITGTTITGTTITGTTLVNAETLQVNDDANIIYATYYFTGTPAATDQVFFVATRAMRVVSISEVHSVAQGGAANLQVTKDTSTNAPGAGTDLLTNNTNAGFDLNGTANTVQTGTLTGTAANLLLAAGDRLAVDYSTTIGSNAGIVVTVGLAPI